MDTNCRRDIRKLICLPKEKQVVRLGSAPGSEVVIYGEGGLYIKKGADGNVYFRLARTGSSQEYSSYKGNSGYVSLTNIGGDGIQLDKDGLCIQIYQTPNSKAITGVGSWEKGFHLAYRLMILRLKEGKRLGDLNLRRLGPILHIEPENITIQSPNGFGIAVPMNEQEDLRNSFSPELLKSRSKVKNWNIFILIWARIFGVGDEKVFGVVGLDSKIGF